MLAEGGAVTQQNCSAARPQQLDLYLEVPSVVLVKWSEKVIRLGNLMVLDHISETQMLSQS